MKKTLTLLCTLAAMVTLVAPMIAVIATTPTEVERIKDVCYFKIHGKPIQNSGFGVAEWIYKNLSPATQAVRIVVERDFGSGPVAITSLNAPVVAGATVENYVDEGNDVEVQFWVYIDEALTIHEMLWVPPNTN